jgi:hypothetical protein
MDMQILDWIYKTLGPGAALGFLIYMMAQKFKTSDRDIASELLRKVDAIEESVSDVRERVAKIEGKLEGGK